MSNQLPPPDPPEVIEAKLRHAEQLRMWHTFQGPYADPNVPPPKLKLPAGKAGEAGALE